MRLIEVQNLPNQRFQVSLDKQECDIHLYQRSFDKMYMDLTVNGKEVFQGEIVQNDSILPRKISDKFSGYLFFHDRIASSDPTWTGLQERYELYYFSEDDLKELRESS